MTLANDIIDRIDGLLARLRWKCYKLSMLVSLGKLSGWGMERNMIWCAAREADDPEVEKHVESSSLLSAAKIMEYDYPQNFPSKFLRTKPVANRYVYRCRDVAVSPETGAAWIPGKRVFVESLGDIKHFYSWGGLIDVMRPARRLQDENVCVVCANLGYYHWLLDAMAQVLIADRITHSKCKILISSHASRFVKTGLSFFGIEESRIIESSCPLLVSEYVMVARNGDLGIVRDENIAALQESIARQIPESKQRNRHIYISRRLERNRAIANEDQVEKLVASLGFEICYFERMSVAEQLRTIAESSVVMGCHGAGLSNMIAGRIGLKIIELLNPSWFNDCFAQLALKLGFSYEYIMLKRHGDSIEAPLEEIEKFARTWQVKK